MKYRCVRLRRWDHQVLLEQLGVVRAHLSSHAHLALAADTVACASIDAVAAEKSKAVIREAAAEAAKKASLKRARQRGQPRAVHRAGGAGGAQASPGHRRVLARGRGLCWNDSEFVRLGASFSLGGDVDEGRETYGESGTTAISSLQSYS